MLPSSDSVAPSILCSVDVWLLGAPSAERMTGSVPAGIGAPPQGRTHLLHGPWPPVRAEVRLGGAGDVPKVRNVQFHTSGGTIPCPTSCAPADPNAVLQVTC